MLKSPPAIRYLFGQFVLKPAERLLLQGGQPVALSPRAFDVLSMLVEYDGRLVEKDVLLERVWPGVIVENNSLHAVISVLRKVTGDDSIATVPKYGYRFNLPCTVEQSTTTGSAHHFPDFQSSFIGRHDDVATLSTLISRLRVVTVHGPGGAGKTRLAVAIALSLTEKFKDGIWFFDLTSLANGAGLVRRLTALFELRSTGQDSLGSVIEYLRERTAMLVIDNAEHIADAVGTLVDELVSSCSNLVVLTTSRQPIGTPGESIFKIPPLSLPALDADVADEASLHSDSMRLFLDRARLQNTMFQPDAEGLRCIARICHFLDGMPLSIELAASRIRSMSVQEIEQRLDQALQLLVAQSSDAPRRHKTLREVVAWSYGLLDAEEQRVFRRVSVFAGGFTLDTAEALFDESDIGRWRVLGMLESLVDKSMLGLDGFASRSRYRQLESIRQFAQERLKESAESDQWNDRHLRYFLRRVAASGVASASDAAVLRATDIEEDNLQAALTTALERDENTAVGLELCGHLALYWYHKGNLKSGRDIMSALLARQRVASTEDRMLRCKVLNGLSSLCRLLRDDDLAYSAAQQALIIAREEADALSTLSVVNNLTTLFMVQRDNARSASGIRSATRLLAGVSQFETSGVFAVLDCGDGACYPESLSLSEIEVMSKDLGATLQPIEAHGRVAKCLINLAIICYIQERFEASERVAEEALRRAESSGDTTTVANCQARLGRIVERLGQTERSIKLGLLAVEFFLNSGQEFQALSGVDDLAQAFATAGHHETAARAIGVIAALSKKLNIPFSSIALTGDVDGQLPYVPIVAEALGEARFRTLYQSGYETDVKSFIQAIAADMPG